MATNHSLSSWAVIGVHLKNVNWITTPDGHDGIDNDNNDDEKDDEFEKNNIDDDSHNDTDVDLSKNKNIINKI